MDRAPTQDACSESLLATQSAPSAVPLGRIATLRTQGFGEGGPTSPGLEDRTSWCTDGDGVRGGDEGQRSISKDFSQ